MNLASYGLEKISYGLEKYKYHGSRSYRIVSQKCQLHMVLKNIIWARKISYGLEQFKYQKSIVNVSHNYN